MVDFPDLVGDLPGVLMAVDLETEVRTGLENLFGLLVFDGDPFFRVWRVGLG